MNIVNTTPHNIAVYAAGDVRPIGPKGYRLASPDVRPVMVIPAIGIVSRAACVENVTGEVAGIPVLSMQFGDPVNLPEPKAGTAYIVSCITAQAAQKVGRTTEDLYMTARLVRDDAGAIIGCTALSQL